MYKELTFQTYNEKGVFLYTIGEGRDANYLTKTASASFHPQISEYIGNAKPIEGKSQVLLTSLGAGEYWGSNVNGDYFPQEALRHHGKDYGHKTFEYFAKVYKHHINKDPKKSYGDVILAVWHERMKRVELIVTIDHEKAPDLIERINNGEYPEVSMGCLKGDAKILMSDYSMKKIKDIRSGDMVIDASGKISEVAYPHNHEHQGTWIKPTVFGIKEIEPTTEEHPWKVLPKEQLVCKGNKKNLSRKQTKCTPRNHEKKGCIGCSFIDDLRLEPIWKRADELSIGDFVGSPIPKGQAPCKETEHFVSLLGLYLAEGYIDSSGYPSFVVSTDEVSTILSEFEGVFQFKERKHPESDYASFLTIYDKELGKKLKQYAGHKAQEKKLHPDVMLWDEGSQFKLLGSYLNGAGGVYKGAAYFSTCNFVLANQIHQLLLRVGIVSSVNTIRHKESNLVKKETIEYQIWCGTDTSFKLEAYTRKKGLRKSQNINDKRFIAEGYLWSPIVDISTEDCNETVYNIAIDSGEYDRDSYQINGVALHNCKVPYDVCSICGNKAKTRAQYCDHLRYHMNKIPPGYNKKAYALNLQPKFFDISFVLVGADRIAKVMKKIAHVPMEKTAFGLSNSKIAERKQAEIEKQVPSNTEPNTVKVLEEIGERGGELLHDCEKPIPKQIILKITSTSTPGPSFLNKVLSSLLTAGIKPHVNEFQNIALRALGKPDLAEQFERSRTFFDPAAPISNSLFSRFSNQMQISPELADNDILRSLVPILPERSYIRPHLNKRVIHIVKLANEGNLPSKTKEDRSPLPLLPMMGVLTALYAVYGSKSPEALSKAEKLLAKNPAIAATLGATMVGLTEGGLALKGRSQRGKFDFNPDKGMSPNLSWSERINLFNKNPITKTAKVPLAVKTFAGVPAIYFLSGGQKIRHAQDPQGEGFLGKTLRKYPDLLSAGLVGSHFFKKPQFFKNLSKVASEEKVAEFSDDLKSNMLFSLAFPGKSMVARSIGMMTDLGIMKALENAASKRKSIPKRPINYS